jgi:PAS domain S-box-containing protein
MLPWDSTASAVLGLIGPMVPPFVVIGVVLARRREWAGCEWVYFATVAGGCAVWLVGQAGYAWSIATLGGPHFEWLRLWMMFNLTGLGSILIALLARPHRGQRNAELVFAGIDVLVGGFLIVFLFAYFLLVPTSIPDGSSQAVQGIRNLGLFVRGGILLATGALAWHCRGRSWGRAYLTLFLAFILSSTVRLFIDDPQRRFNDYSATPYDLAWLLPFFALAWMASWVAPERGDSSVDGAGERQPFWPAVLALGVMALVGYAGPVIQPVPAEAGELRSLLTAFSIIVVLLLITARMALQRGDLRRADARIRLLAVAAEHTDSLIVVVAANGLVDYANTAFQEAIGRSMDRAPFEETLTQESLARLPEARAAAVAAGVWRGNYEHVRRDGTTLPVSGTLVPLRSPSGKVTHYVGVARDVTDELKVREQMIHTERLSAVGELVAGVAHELNNPLQSVVGFAELLQHRPIDAEMQRDLSVIVSEASRARDIVLNLLSFSRRSRSARQPLSVNELVRGTLSLRTYFYEGHGIEVDLKLADGLPAALINGAEVRQVVLNLLLNAEHALERQPAGQRRISLSTTLEAGQVVLRVADSGPGVPAELRHRIFEPFFTTRVVGEGTGLGLSISIGIASAQGGSLTLESPASGASFRLALPATDQPAVVPHQGLHDDARREVAALALPPAAAPAQAGAPLAMVVDDEPAVRMLLARLLEKQGYVVRSAENGEEALAWSDEPFEIVFCDVRMPKVGGRELFKQMSERQPRLANRFVFITGDTLSQDIVEFSSRHHIVMLSKPFTTGQFRDVLKQVAQ